MNLIFLFETDDDAETAAQCMNISLENLDTPMGMRTAIEGTEYVLDIDQSTGMWGLFSDADNVTALTTLWRVAPEECPMRQMLAAEFLLSDAATEAPIRASLSA